MIKSNDLTRLPNIGKVLAEKLKIVGIESTNELKSTGTEQTFIRLKVIYPDVCINTLRAIEGAIQGIRWHDLSEQKKRELQELYNMKEVKLK